MSIALHAAIIAAILAVAGGRILSEPEDEYVEMEILPPDPVVKLEPEPEPEPEPEIPVAERPPEVPKQVVARVVDKARPFQPESARHEGEREAPEDAQAIPLPTQVAPLRFDMSETVGGGAGFDYSSTNSGGMALPPPGPRGGAPGSSNAPGATNVRVANDWQVTRQARPTNDRSFEPRYPPLAKRQGREAVIVLSLDIDASGQVARAEAIEGPEGHGFRESAVAYARKLRFEPARSGATAIATRIEWSVHFYVRN